MVLHTRILFDMVKIRSEHLKSFEVREIRQQMQYLIGIMKILQL